jgi:hypothetical protein
MLECVVDILCINMQLRDVLYIQRPRQRCLCCCHCPINPFCAQNNRHCAVLILPKPIYETVVWGLFSIVTNFDNVDIDVFIVVVVVVIMEVVDAVLTLLCRFSKDKKVFVSSPKKTARQEPFRIDWLDYDTIKNEAEKYTTSTNGSKEKFEKHSFIPAILIHTNTD